MELHKNNWIETILTCVNITVGLLILWISASTFFIGTGKSEKDKTPKIKKSPLSSQTEKKQKINIHAFLYKNSSLVLKSQLIQEEDSIESLTLKGTLLSEEKGKSVAFIEDALGVSKILQEGDRYLGAKLVELNFTQVVFQREDGQHILKIMPIPSKKSKISRKPRKIKKRLKNG